MRVLCLVVWRLRVPNIVSLCICFVKKCAPHLIKVGEFAWYSIKICLIFGVRFERRKVDKKKQIYRKTGTRKLYSGVFWILLPNVIKIDPYKFELYCFKVGAFFLRHSVYNNTSSSRNFSNMQQSHVKNINTYHEQFQLGLNTWLFVQTCL